MVIPAIPPTTPPAITPTFELFEVDCAVEDSVAVVDVVVKEADTLVIDEVIELVGCTWVEVASGESKESECQLAQKHCTRVLLTSSPLRCCGVEHVISHLQKRVSRQQLRLG